MKEQILLTLCYDGMAFAGYQVQKNARTVQSAVQDAIEALYGERYDVVGCSRTDAGVHARDYKLTFRPEKKDSLTPEKLISALNAHLPQDIAVTGAQRVPDGFHVRHDVFEKEYEYIVKNTAVRDPFSRGHAYHYPHRMDAVLLNEAAAAFLGKHDFAAFMATGSKITDSVRTVRSVSVHREGDCVVFRIAADGFLYNMVRIFVGTLLDVARGKIQKEDISDIIASGDRARAGATVPPDGLYLNRVRFQDNAFGKEDMT